MSACTNPDIGQMIGRYEFGLLTPEEKQAFEVHALECDACFQDLHAFSPAVKIIKKNVKQFRKAVQPEKSGFHLFSLFVPQKTVRFAFAAAAMILLAVIGLEMKDRLLGPAPSNEIILSQDEPQLLTPHDPDIQAARGELEIAKSGITALIQSMQGQIDQENRRVLLSWKAIPDIQSYSIVLMDQSSQDTLFAVHGIEDTRYALSLDKVPVNQSIDWQLSGFSGEEQLVRVHKKVHLK